MPPVPLEQFARAADQWRRGYDVSQPWRLRHFARVELASYVWALLHDPGFRDLVEEVERLERRMAVPPPVPDVAPGGQHYIVRSPFGIGDPRGPAIGASWDENLQGWVMPRDRRSLQLMRSAFSDPRAGRRSDRPVAVDAGDRVLLFCAYGDKGRVPQLPGRRWIPTQRAWSFPREGHTISALVSAFGQELLASESLRSLLREDAEVPQVVEQATTGVVADEPLVSASAPEAEAQPIQEAVPESGEAKAYPSKSDQSGPIAAPWRSRSGEDPAVVWLRGDLTEIEFLGVPGPPGESVAASAAAGNFDEALEAASKAEPGTPREAAMLLVGTVCAASRARHPLELRDAPLVESLPFEPSLLHNLLRRTLDAKFDDERARASLSLALVFAATYNSSAPEILKAALKQIPSTNPLFAHAHELAVRWSASVHGVDEEIGPEIGNALGHELSARAFADLFLEAWAYDRVRLCDSLLRWAAPVVLRRQTVRDLRAEVIEVIESATSPALPAFAREAANLQERRLLVDGDPPAQDVADLYEAVLQIALKQGNGEFVREAWERLVRWHLERGESDQVVRVAQLVRVRPDLAADAETAIAYALADQGELESAVSGLVDAARRVRSEEDRNTLLAEARLIAERDPALNELVPPQHLSDEGAPRWPSGEHPLIVGGNDALRQRGRELLKDAGIDVTWVTSQEAERGTGVRDVVRGRATFVVLLTPHIGHDISFRVRAAAGEKRVIPFSSYGVSGLPRALFQAAAGQNPRFVPHGQQ